MNASENRITLTENQLSKAQREAFKAAFLDKGSTVQWEGETYTIVMMDQDYPEDDSEYIRVSFQLERLES